LVRSQRHVVVGGCVLWLVKRAEQDGDIEGETEQRVGISRQKQKQPPYGGLGKYIN